MGFFDSIGSGLSGLFGNTDPLRAAQIRGAMLGGAQALLQPYSGIGNALVGAGQGYQQGKENYLGDQTQTLKNQQLQLQTQQMAAQRAAQNRLLLGSAAPPSAFTPSSITPPSQPTAAANPPLAPSPIAPQPAAPSDAAPRVPAGFNSIDEFRTYAMANPEDAMKRLYPEPQPFKEAPHEGLNPNTGQMDQFLVEPVTGAIKWLGTGGGKARDFNQPFNADGSPNVAYQKYQRDMKAFEASQSGDNKNPFTAPITVEASDPRNPGQRTQFLAQQDKKTGQWYTGDQTRAPLTDVMLPGGVPGGGRAAAQVGRMIGAAKDVVTGLQNVSALPVTASTGLMGLLGGKQEAHGLLDATKTVLANQMTSQEVQSTKAMYVGIAKAIGTLDAGGLQTSDTFLKQIGGLMPADGDTQMTKLLKLAELRQQADNALESQLNGPLLSSQQKVYAKSLRQSLAKSIPFTPLDVLKLDKSADLNATMASVAQKSGLGPKSMLPAKINGDEDYAKLKSGSFYIGPDGKTRQKP